MKNISKNRGFTLVELLVVIAIIGILSAVVMANFQDARKKSRDAKRISDIAQLQLALEQYFDKNQAYPGSLDTLKTGTVYISTIPRDPNGSSYCYTVNGYDYILGATFELSNSSVLDGLPAPTTCGSINCNNTAGSTGYCMGPK